VRNIHSKRLVTYNRRSICVKVSTKARSPVRRGEANIDIDEYINTSRRENERASEGEGSGRDRGRERKGSAGRLKRYICAEERREPR
jgi:hypothetical protein